jgi:hypothetical protein
LQPAPACTRTDMATRKPKATGQVKARALVDLPQHDAKCGELLIAEALVVQALVADGSADDHPDAVAYAEQQASSNQAALTG